MFLYFCHEVLRRLVVSISHQRPLLLIISHLASIVGYTKKNKCVCFLHCKQFFLSLGLGQVDPPPQSLKNSLLALIILLYGLWSKRGNWTRLGLKNNPVFWVSTSGRQKIQKKLCCTHRPWPTSPPACPCRPIKGRSSSRRLEYRGAHLLQEYRGAALS